MEPISLAIGVVSLGIDAGTLVHERVGGRTDGEGTRFESVLDFWTAFRDGRLAEGDRVTVAGSLTDYGPVTFGPPRAVKEGHFRLRESLADADVDPGTIDGLVSISSGNPLIRVAPENGVRYAGLYEGIGRNSIPVFVDSDRFSAWHDGFDGDVRDAAVTGVLRPIPGAWQDLMELFGLPEETSGYALHVGSDGAIEDQGPTSFFEADIWAAFSVGGADRWVSRAPNLARLREHELDLAAVAETAERFGDDATLVGQYDLEDKPVSEYIERHTDADVGSERVQVAARGNVRETYVERIRDLLPES
ncbi:MAG: hypothetical protein ABEJ74_06965 [Haloferacaceae archaeon]